MEKIYLKEFAVFEMLDKHFLTRTATMFSQEIDRDTFDRLRPLTDVFELDADDAVRARLTSLRLVSDTPMSRERIRQNDQRKIKHMADKLRLAAIELMVAQGCNMACTYCYGCQGEYGQPGIMSKETAFRAVDMLKREVDKGNVNEIPTIVFFGGEPLLNMPVIKAVAAYATELFGERAPQFGITTNLTLMDDDMLDFFVKYHIAPLVSFDGPPEYQRKNRVIKNGDDSYDVVTRNIRRLLERIPNARARATLVEGDNRERVAEEFRRLGFAQYQIEPASGNLIEHVRRDGGAIYANKQGDVLVANTVEFFEALHSRDAERVRRLLRNVDAKTDHIYSALRRFAPEYRFIGCGVGRTMVAVSHTGEIFPCHRLTGQEKYRLGSLDEGFGKGVFEKHIITENPDCAKCFIRYCCTGDCAHHNASDAPEKPGVDPVFRNTEGFCHQKKMEFMLEAYVRASVTDAERKWLADEDLIKSTITL